MDPVVVGMVWYQRENFAHLRTMFEDGNNLPENYDKWLAAAERGRQSQEAQGHRVICVNIDPDDFSAWCRMHGLKLDAKARVKYANLMAAAAGPTIHS